MSTNKMNPYEVSTSSDNEYKSDWLQVATQSAVAVIALVALVSLLQVCRIAVYFLNWHFH